MRTHLPGWILLSLGAAACSPSLPERLEPLMPKPVPAPRETPPRIEGLIERLGEEAIERRESAAAELKRLGAEEPTQAGVVDALRAAATRPETELRARAREVLREIERFESILPGYGPGRPPMGFRYQDPIRSIELNIWFRPFADGSAEAEVQLNQAPPELFFGTSCAELYGKLNAAARERGYPKALFQIEEDGSIKVGGASSSFGNPAGTLVPDWHLSVELVGPENRLLPPPARGGWLIRARALSGRGWAHGLRIGDVIAEVDGAKPKTVEELRAALRSATSLKIHRPDFREIRIGPLD